MIKNELRNKLTVFYTVLLVVIIFIGIALIDYEIDQDFKIILAVLLFVTALYSALWIFALGTLVQTVKKFCLNFFCGEKERQKCMGLSSEELLEIVNSPDSKPELPSPFAKTVRRIMRAKKPEGEPKED